MSELALHSAHTQIATLARVHLENRIIDSVEAQVLSSHGGKRLAVRESANGDTFVLRSLTDEAVDELENPIFGDSIELSDGLKNFQQLFRAAGLAVVQTNLVGRLLNFDGGQATHIVSEHLADAQVMKKSSPLETRRAAVAGLARVLSNQDYLPGPEALRSDLFVVNNDEPTIVDVDPRLIVLDRWFKPVANVSKGAYLSCMPNLIGSWATTAEEVKVLAGTFLREMPPTILDDSQLLGNVFEIHALTQTF